MRYNDSRAFGAPRFPDRARGLRANFRERFRHGCLAMWHRVPGSGPRKSLLLWWWGQGIGKSYGDASATSL